MLCLQVQPENIPSNTDFTCICYGLVGETSHCGDGEGNSTSMDSAHLQGWVCDQQRQTHPASAPCLGERVRVKGERWGVKQQTWNLRNVFKITAAVCILLKDDLLIPICTGRASAQVCAVCTGRCVLQRWGRPRGMPAAVTMCTGILQKVLDRARISHKTEILTLGFWDDLSTYLCNIKSFIYHLLLSP